METSSQRTLAVVAAILLALVAGVGGYLGWRQIDALDGQVRELSRQVVELATQTKAAERRAAQADERADAAEERAAEAERRADTAEEQTATARGEATTAQQSAADAANRARDEAAARAAAEAARRAAEEDSRKAAAAAQSARAEAEEARRDAEELRRQRERDVTRLQRALEKISDTQRTALGLVMSLGGDSIEFDFDKAELRPENRELLSRVAGVLLTAEDFQIQIYGHTDDVGTEEYNQQLSERRAEAVRDYLVEAGVDPAIITTRGFGKTRPLVEGTDPESRQRNRRVEIALVQSSIQYDVEPLAEGGGDGDG